jgi:methionyl-tRNA synthetase
MYQKKEINKRFHSKCCKADILYDSNKNKDYCYKCHKVLSDSDIIEDKNA